MKPVLSSKPTNSINHFMKLSTSLLIERDGFGWRVEYPVSSSITSTRFYFSIVSFKKLKLREKEIRTFFKFEEGL